MLEQIFLMDFFKDYTFVRIGMSWMNSGHFFHFSEWFQASFVTSLAGASLWRVPAISGTKNFRQLDQRFGDMKTANGNGLRYRNQFLEVRQWKSHVKNIWGRFSLNRPIIGHWIQSIPLAFDWLLHATLLIY